MNRESGTARKVRRETRTCECCGVEYQVTVGRRGGVSPTCSNDCRDLLAAERTVNRLTLRVTQRLARKRWDAPPDEVFEKAAQRRSEGFKVGNMWNGLGRPRVLNDRDPSRRSKKRSGWRGLNGPKDARDGRGDADEGAGPPPGGEG